MAETRHVIGLLLGTEEDWPRAFETLLAPLGAITDASGKRHRITNERITIEPFDLRDRPHYELVIDRLAYWYYHPREWLKKVALMNDVYLSRSTGSGPQRELIGGPEIAIGKEVGKIVRRGTPKAGDE